MRIYNNKAVIANLDIPIHWEAMKSFNKIVLDCIGLHRQFRHALQTLTLRNANAIHDTWLATELLLSRSHQKIPNRNKTGATLNGQPSDCKLFSRQEVMYTVTGLTSGVVCPF